jgi:hypothetical protein
LWLASWRKKVKISKMGLILYFIDFQYFNR